MQKTRKRYGPQASEKPWSELETTATRQNHGLGSESGPWLGQGLRLGLGPGPAHEPCPDLPCKSGSQLGPAASTDTKYEHSTVQVQYVFKKGRLQLQSHLVAASPVRPVGVYLSGHGFVDLSNADRIFINHFSTLF